MATFQEHKAHRKQKARARRFAGAVILGLLSPPAVAERAAAERVPGVGPDDRRAPVETAVPPWNSVVKVQSELGVRCTGALVGPQQVVTAAHCLIGPSTRKPVQPSSLHVLFGYDRGQYRGHARVRAVVSGPGADSGRPPDHGPLAHGPLDGLAVDWAVLLLDGPVPAGVPVLPLEPAPPYGQTVALGGYSRDRAQILMADTACTLLGRSETAAGALLVHDCDGTRGTSGGPLLVRRGGGWAVAGVNVAVVSGGGQRRSLACPGVQLRLCGEVGGYSISTRFRPLSLAW